MKVVVGLGNPGREYAGTRHNVGFDVVDRLADRLAWAVGAGEFDRLARSKFDGIAMDGTASDAAGERLLLLKPGTFMNLSGRSVRAALAFYQLEPHDLLVVVDEMALPVGKIRLRPDGSHGGHNGLRDVERALGTQRYPRLRVGIDAPPARVPGREYVLGRFSDEQRRLMVPVLDRAASAVLTWATSGIEAAMNQFNAEGIDKP